MGKFKFIDTALAGVVIVEPTVFGDERGFFMESYSAREYAEGGIDAVFVQDNHSRSRRGVLRGLHYQWRQPQGKLVRVAAGSVLDVAVDIRTASPTFGQWVSVELSAGNKRQLYVPAGFAHGFLTLEDGTDFLYKCTDYYAPEYDAGIRWDDAQIAIDWRLEHYGFAPGEVTLSAADAVRPLLCDVPRDRLFGH